MKTCRLLIALLTPLLLPIAARAQLTAPAAGGSLTTGELTRKTETVYAFFDHTPMALTAAQPQGDAAEVIWQRLNVAQATLDTLLVDTIARAAASTLDASRCPGMDEGGYRAVVKSLDNPAAAIDTFTTWAFRDTFQITAIAHEQTCDALRLDIRSTPSIYAPYVYYSFPNAAYPFVQNTFQGVQSVEWSTNHDIHEGVDDPDESWRTRKHTPVFIDNPPPLYDAEYTVTVLDVFSRPASYTLSVPAVAAHAKISVWEKIDGQWKTPDGVPKGEALYELQFSAEESIHATRFHWKGFGNENRPGAGGQILWQDSTAVPTDRATPQMWHKGAAKDGYLPGKYTVRLIARNEATGCADSTDLAGIEVAPSQFHAEAIPNAFTPNGDGHNDVFKFVKGNEPVSLENIKVYIYSRAGTLVYRYEGRADAWEGWDGRLAGNRGQVADGLYFYILSGEGWDGIPYHAASYKGSLHIFR